MPPPVNQRQELLGNPLAPLCEQWLAKIEIAKKFKQERFGKYADECARFFSGPQNAMWDEMSAAIKSGGGFLSSGDGAIMPRFRITINKPFEAVAYFGPALYHQNPNVQVVRDMEAEVDPLAIGIQDDGQPDTQQLLQSIAFERDADSRIQDSIASILQHYANWLQREADKKTHSRRAICEAIVKGMSLIQTGIRVPAGSEIRIPTSRYLSVDDLQVDPDAVYWEDVQWIAVYCCHPVNLVEEEYGLPPGSLRGSAMSGASQGNTFGSKRETTERTRRGRGPSPEKGRTHDLIEYWRIYSKNGMGDHLARTSKEQAVYSKFDFTPFGRYIHLAVAKGVPYPLNIPNDALQTEEFEQLAERVQWPIPYWGDENSDGGWPVSRLWFCDDTNSVWPLSMFRPVIGEIRFVNWCMSFLADKTAAACTTYVGMMKAAGASIQKQLSPDSLEVPYKVIEIANDLGRNINEIVSFIQAPSFPMDIWKMVAEVMEQIDKRTGLTELIYGMSSRQLRSAREADVKQQAVGVRPDDMASQVENFLSCVAAKELQAAQWTCEPQDVVGAVGPLAAKAWGDHIATRSLDQLFRDFKVRIEAGTSRKPNKGVRIDNLNTLGQTIMPAIQQMAVQGGQVGPWNAFISEIAKSLEIDPAAFLLQPPPPPDPNQPDPAAIQAQMEQQQAQLRLQEQQLKMLMDQQSHVQEMRQDEESHKQEMEQARARARLDSQAARARATATRRNGNMNGGGRK